MPYRIETTSTFDRGMKEALKSGTKAIPEYGAISDLIQNGLELPPGRNLEKLYDRPDGPVYSIRVTDGRRLTFQILKGQTLRLRCVGEHDKTYDKDRNM